MEKNKRAIVTGGSRGIGRAILIQLAKTVCSDVMFTDIAFPNDDIDGTINSIKEEINDSSVNIYAFQANATVLDDATKSIEFGVDKMGGVDILVNNAGITKDNLLLRMTESDFDAVINVNLKSVFNYTKAVLKPMMGQRYGRIVNIASVVGIIGNPGQTNYVASKAGVIGITKTHAKEFASRNITVNAVAPGFIETDMTKKLSDEQRETLLKNVPLKRMGQPEDIANVVSFLCSESADYLTGQVITVDGGMVM